MTKAALRFRSAALIAYTISTLIREWYALPIRGLEDEARQVGVAGDAVERLVDIGGIHEMTLNKWMRQADIDKGNKPKDLIEYNAGISKATKAAQAVGGEVIIPNFDSVNKAVA